MRLSIIIIALNERETIRRAVDAAWRAGADEVIVVDGGSCDDTLAEVRGRCHGVTSKAGRAIQQNRGALVATGDVLLFQHADNWFDADVARQVAEALQNDHVVGGCFRQAITHASWRFRWLEWGNALRAKWMRLPYGDQGIFIRRVMFEQIGGFEEVPLMEDVLLARQMRRNGRIALLPGPLKISARRWQRHGFLRQTLRNWLLITAFRCGASPKRLANFYPRHDQPSDCQQTP